MAGEQTTWDSWDDTNYKENRMSNTGLLQAGGTSKILDSKTFLTVPINFQGTLSQIHLTLPDLSAGTVTVSILDASDNVVWARDTIADNGFRVIDVNVQVRGTDKLKILTSIAVSGSKTITIMLLFSKDGTRASLMQGIDANSNTRNVLIDADGKFFVIGGGGGTIISTIKIEDGDTAVLVDILDAPADALAATLNGMVTDSRTYSFNGSTHDQNRNITGLSNSDAGAGVTLKSYNNSGLGLQAVALMGYDNTADHNAYRAIAVDSTGRVKLETDITLDGSIQVNVAAFKDTAGTSADAFVYVDGVDLSSVSDTYLGVGGWDATANKFRALPISIDNTELAAASSTVIVGGKYLTEATLSTYNTKDNAVLQMDVNGRVRVFNDGVYVATYNPIPNTTGLIVNTPAAALTSATQTVRTTGGLWSVDGLVAANVSGLDVRSIGYIIGHGGVIDRVSGIDAATGTISATLLDSFTNTPVGMSMGLSMGYDSTASNFAYRAIAVDSAGKIKIGTQYIDDSTDFTLTTSPVTALGAIVDDVSPASVSNDGDIGILRMTANRKLLTHVDGFYNATTNINLNPESVGLIAHTPAAAPANTDQIVRVTGAINADAGTVANIHGLDVRAVGYGLNGASPASLDVIRTIGALSGSTYNGVLPNFHNASTGIPTGVLMGYDNTGAANAYRALSVTDTGKLEVALTDGSTTVKFPTSTARVRGAALGGLTVLASAGASTYNRIHKMTIVSDADTVLTFSDSVGAVDVVAGVPIPIDFSPIGHKQTTAATAVTVTSSSTANVSVWLTYSTET